MNFYFCNISANVNDNTSRAFDLNATLMITPLPGNAEIRFDWFSVINYKANLGK